MAFFKKANKTKNQKKTMYIVKINNGVTPELFLASDVEVEKNKKFKSNLKITRIDGMIIRAPRDPKVVSIIKK